MYQINGKKNDKSQTGVENPRKNKKVMPENCRNALEYLFNPVQKSDTIREYECKLISYYLARAVANIQTVADIDKTDERKLDFLLEDPEKLQKAAKFIWLFRMPAPGEILLHEKNGKELKVQELTLKLIKKIFELRNFFAHENPGDIRPLLADRVFFELLEGVLLENARRKVAYDGSHTEKLSKLKLMNLHKKESDPGYVPEKQYELTRKGIIFLTCMGLYKDEAKEFCQQFADLKLPEKCAWYQHEICDSDVPCEKPEGKQCNSNRIKKLCEMFTFFSIKRSQKEFRPGDKDYLRFAEIISYLNKVPRDSFELLPLDEERQMLQIASDESDEENKEQKYALHLRFEQKFLAFAAGYCEDFGLLPCIHFKRLDTSLAFERTRYTFDIEQDADSQNRHYVIKNDAIHFEFRPTEHYGEIHLDALHSAIGESEFKNLLYAGTRQECGWERINELLTEYFSSYHKILETLLNVQEPEDIVTVCRERLLDDFCRIARIVPEEYGTEACNKKLEKYFSANLIKFINGLDSSIPMDELHAKLLKRLMVLKQHAQDFIKRLETLENWRSIPQEKRITPYPPDCVDVSYEPFSSRMTDQELIQWVFTAFNLNLPDKDKFRQLPMSKQHRPGATDHEFQLVHRAVGKYSLDQKGLIVLLKKNKRTNLAELLDNNGDLMLNMLEQQQAELRLIGNKIEEIINSRLPFEKITVSEELLTVIKKCPLDEEELTGQIQKALKITDEQSFALQKDLEHCYASGRPGYGVVRNYAQRLKISDKLIDKALRKVKKKTLRAELVRLNPKIRKIWHDIAPQIKPLAERSRKVSLTLQMLARAAAVYCRDEYEKEYSRWSSGEPYSFDVRELHAACRRFGVKPGMSLSTGALLKNILGINLTQWQNAYNYAEKTPFTDRSLATESHFVSQIPLPNGFSDRFIPFKRGMEKLFVNGVFDFNLAFRQMKTEFQLRDFYGVDLLKRAVMEKQVQGADRKKYDRAIRSILRCFYQDKLLLKIANAYHCEALKKENCFLSARPEKDSSIFRIFDRHEVFEDSGIKIFILLNDLLKPSFNSVRHNIQLLARTIDPKRKEFYFYELSDKLQNLLHIHRNKSLEILPLLDKFEQGVCPQGAANISDRRAYELPYYQKTYPGFTEKEYDILADTRNAVYHGTLSLDISEAKAILNRYLKLRYRNGRN